VTLDLNNVTAVFIDLMSSGLAHAKDALECPLDERIMMSQIPCSTGMKRRCVRCITGPRMKMKCCMLAVLRKSDLGNPLDLVHDIRSR
jgi:hypothetical protein